MSNPKDGGPAFPFTYGYRHANEGETVAGMTLRDLFAAKALVGMLPNYYTERSHEGDAALASLAYGMADAMLAERNK